MSTLNLDVFLLDLHNRNIAAARRALLRVIRDECLLLGALVILLLVFAGMFLHGAAQWLTIDALNRSPLTAEGEVLSLRQPGTGAMTQSSHYFITYTYHVPSSTTAYTQEEFVTRSTYDRFQPGDAVQIKYLADDPAQARLVLDQMPLRVKTGVMVEIVLGMGVALLIILAGMPVCLQLWGNVRLFQQGSLVQGQMLRCQPVVPEVDVARAIQQEKRRAIPRSFWIEVSYRFKTPDGKEIRSTATGQRDDLSHARLPKFGVPVAIWYLDPQHYRLL